MSIGLTIDCGVMPFSSLYSCCVRRRRVVSSMALRMLSVITSAYRRSRRMDHAGRVLLVSPHTTGVRKADAGLLRSAGTDSPDQPGPAGIQPAPAGTNGPNLRADVHHHRRGHVLQPWAHGFAAHLR